MKFCRIHLVAIISLLVLLFPSTTIAWGEDGHAIVCKIAQPRLNEVAAEAVKKLLPKSAGNDLGYNRDCKDEDGLRGRCVAGAINNYTNQLLSYSSNSDSKYNLTQALLFLSHFIGDIHQPLHVGFTSDRGGNTIDVHWFTRKTNLHHVWDDNIIETAEQRFYDSNIDGFIDAIQQNITEEWSDQVGDWETCDGSKTTCPNIYASEGIKAACEWAYKDVSENSVLGDDYFSSRLPTVNLRLAQAGVRLAATLNRIFRSSKPVYLTDSDFLHF
ncbi:hypothetical protein K1719_040608 [Acacia pycnantha]|nr:hypothetical protein K1719_040608 [Acacia pycnantha]